MLHLISFSLKQLRNYFLLLQNMCAHITQCLSTSKSNKDLKVKRAGILKGIKDRAIEISITCGYDGNYVHLLKSYCCAVLWNFNYFATLKCTALNEMCGWIISYLLFSIESLSAVFFLLKILAVMINSSIMTEFSLTPLQY